MAGNANIPAVSETTPDEVSQSAIAPAEETGVQNGLGLELLFPKTLKPKIAAAKAKVAAAELEEDLDEKAEDPKEPKKETPPKDEKTGRFLPRKAPEIPVEDAKDGEDATQLKKRLKDTRDWATTVNKQNQEWKDKFSKLESEFKVLQSKQDGTYDESASSKVDPIELAKLTERTKISRVVANGIYTEALVNELVFDDGSPYRQLEQMDPFVKSKVFASEQPVLEAIRQLKWKQMTDKYGDDPDKVVDTLREELKTELVETFKLKNRSKRTIDDVDGLSGMNGGDEDHKPHTSPSTFDLRKQFPLFSPGSF